LKPTLAATFPGRFTTVSPAAVELHVDLDLASEMVNRVVLTPDTVPERHCLPEVQDVAGGLLLGDRGYYGKDYLQRLDAAGGFFIVRAKTDINPLILHARDGQGHELEHLCGKRLKSVASQLATYDCVDLRVRFDTGRSAPFDCRLVVHPHLRERGVPRYLVTNLDAEDFSPEQVSDGYRLRWQIELLFKEWKSHANLHAFDTSNPNIAEGLIWASLCAATLTRYCAHLTQAIAKVPMSTQRVAKCTHHVLRDVLGSLMHDPGQLERNILAAVRYLSRNAQRAHPKRDQRTGRLKLGLMHVCGAA
jgi:hypothetical protein